MFKICSGKTATTLDCNETWSTILGWHETQNIDYLQMRMIIVKNLDTSILRMTSASTTTRHEATTRSVTGDQTFFRWSQSQAHCTRHVHAIISFLGPSS